MDADSWRSKAARGWLSALSAVRPWDGLINRLAVDSDRAAKTAGRQTVIRSTEASGRAWRRISDGNPCAFCAMLVSRGPIYTSSQAAGEVVGVRGVARGKRKTGELFHDHCGCTVVEFYGSWADWKPTAREQEFIDLYNRDGGSLKHMRAAIDAIKEVSPGKEYLLGAGKHMTVIRRDPKTNMFYYLELESRIPEGNGWQTLTNKGQRDRFGWFRWKESME